MRGFAQITSNQWRSKFCIWRFPRESAKLNSWFTQAIQAPEVKPRLLELGLFPVGQCGASFGSFLQQQFEAYGRITGQITDLWLHGLPMTYLQAETDEIGKLQLAGVNAIASKYANTAGTPV